MTICSCARVKRGPAINVTLFHFSFQPFFALRTQFFGEPCFAQVELGFGHLVRATGGFETKYRSREDGVSSLPTSPQDPSKPIDLQIWYFYPLVKIGRIDGQKPVLPVSVKVNP